MVKIEKACLEIKKYLKAEYKKKGHNFLFNARKIKIKNYSTHLTGSVLGKMEKAGSIIRHSDSDSSPRLYKTRFKE